eukprot:757171-Hanusia_phi.AAC.1
MEIREEGEEGEEREEGEGGEEGEEGGRTAGEGRKRKRQSRDKAIWMKAGESKKSLLVVWLFLLCACPSDGFRACLGLDVADHRSMQGVCANIMSPLTRSKVARHCTYAAPR